MLNINILIKNIKKIYNIIITNIIKLKTKNNSYKKIYLKRIFYKIIITIIFT